MKRIRRRIRKEAPYAIVAIATAIIGTWVLELFGRSL